jgi:hypothetical protein
MPISKFTEWGRAAPGHVPVRSFGHTQPGVQPR